MLDYRNPDLAPDRRAELLLQEMSLEEKLFQLQSQLLFLNQYQQKRDYRVGHIRNIGHFMQVEHPDVTPGEVARAINEDTRRSIEASPHGIPVLQNGEALHGAQWGSATCFPQAIALASMFDDGLVHEIGKAVAEELRAVGVRHVFAPVVNLVRDCRWGRTEESYGEDVCLVSRTGAAYTKGLEQGGVIAAPKHFVDNYADGGRDSNVSHSSWRTLREVYLEPFRACFQEGGARSVMMAYNSLDGEPCSCNSRLMQDILRDEWGFDGFVISDYGGVDGIFGAHELARSQAEAQAMALKAGLDVDLPNGYGRLKEALDQGFITERDVDRAVKRVLKCKFELGLFERPYVDPEQAEKVVRCPAHRALALKAAQKSMVLLKNDGLLPLRKTGLSKIGLFGPAVNTVNVGGYSGPYGGWKAADALTPYQALKAYLGDSVELVLHQGDQGVIQAAKACDLALYFSATLEGEGTDRCSLKLPNKKISAQKSEGSTWIIGEQTNEISVDQESILRDLVESGVKTCVVLINGAPVEVAHWADQVQAILEAWYPGEQGAQAIVQTLFGENNPGGKLPICFPRSIGQLPLYYAHQPTGRGYGYIENDGSPYYGFGYGLSYTQFELSGFEVEDSDLEHYTLKVSVDIKNVGDYPGDEVLQLYLHGSHCGVVRPVKELKTFKRVSLAPGEERRVTLCLGERELSFWNRELKFGPHACDYELMLGVSAQDIRFTHSFKIP